MDLSAYLAESICDIMTKAYLNVLNNPREARFMARMQRNIGKAERRRKECLDKEGLKVPLFRKIRDARALGWEHTGGCTLYEHRDEVKTMME